MIEAGVEEEVEVEVEINILKINILIIRKATGTKRKVPMISVDYSPTITIWKKYSSNKANHIRLQCVLIFREAVVSKEKDAHSHIVRPNSTNISKASSVQPVK